MGELNSFIMKQSLYIDREDWELANTYLTAVKHYKELMDSAGSAESKQAMSDTRPYPPDMGVSVQEIMKINQEVTVLREKMVEKYRGILSGKG
jgi:hypothetical protein